MVCLLRMNTREMGTTRFINASKDWRMQSSGHSDAQVAMWTDTTAAFGLITGKGGGQSSPKQNGPWEEVAR